MPTKYISVLSILFFSIFTQAESDKSTLSCEQLLAVSNIINQSPIVKSLAKLHPNKKVSVKIYLPTNRAEDRSSSSSLSIYKPILTRLGQNQIVLVDNLQVDSNRSYMIIRGSAKRLQQLFMDLNQQETATGEKIIQSILLMTPLINVDSRDFSQVKESKERFKHSEFLNFPAYGGVGIGKGNDGQYILRVGMIKDQEGPNVRINDFEGIRVEYYWRDNVVAY